MCQNKINFNYGALFTADLDEIYTSHIQRSYFLSLGLGEWQEQQQVPVQVITFLPRQEVLWMAAGQKETETYAGRNKNVKSTRLSEEKHTSC